MVGISKIRFTFLRENTTESENVCKMAKKYKNAKNDKNIFLLKLNKRYVSYTLETLLHGLGRPFLVPYGAPVLALLSHFCLFWVKIRAAVQANLYRWTGVII